MKPDAKLHRLLGAFKSLKSIGEQLNGMISVQFAATATAMDVQKVSLELGSQVPGLIASYEMARNQAISETNGDFLPEYLELPKDWNSVRDFGVLRSTLVRLIVNCDSALAYLNSILSPITRTEFDTLQSLRGQIAPLQEKHPKLVDHLIRAIEEYEIAHYLAATMVASKASAYVLDQLRGATDEAKIQYLVSTHVLEGRLKDDYLRGIKKSRNYYSHDLNSIPEPQEALGVLSTACDLALKYSKMKD